MSTLTAWMLIPTYYPVIGGAQSQVHRLSKVLQAHDWSVQVLTRQHSYAHPQGLPASDMMEGTPIVRLYSRGGTMLGSLFYLIGGLWYLLRYGRRSIYHAHDIGASGWLAVAAGRLLGGRSIIKLRTGCYAYRQLLTSRRGRWPFLTLLRLADRVVVVNSEVEELMAELGIPAKRVVRIPNTVDINQFSFISPEEKLKTRLKLNLAVDETIVLYVGRLEQLKGVDILLQAWAGLPENIRGRARLLLVGDGPERERLLALKRSLEIDPSVDLLGERQNVLDYYHAADIFVLPSRTEGLSNALLEAMACGLPAIASDVGGAVDLIQPGQNGILFKSEEQADLARHLIELLKTPDLWQPMGLRARDSVIQYANLPLVLERLQWVYQDLLR